MMNSLKVTVVIILLAIGCSKVSAQKIVKKNVAFNTMLEEYMTEKLNYFPLEATQNGDSKHNAELVIDFTESHRATLKMFYYKYLQKALQYNRIRLNDNDKISYDVFVREMRISLRGLTFKNNLTPLNQFYGMHLEIGQLGSGDGNQPFKSIQDYDHWISRASLFSNWVDSAIVYFKKGVSENYTLPKSLVEKIIPQCKNIIVEDVTKSLFWGPITKLPDSFSEASKQRITKEFRELIKERLQPAYNKLANFFENEYIFNARQTSGISSNPTGSDYYKWLTEYWTTTTKKSQEIYETGLKEVVRIRQEMEKVKEQVGYEKGNLKDFFEFMKTNPQFMPYQTADQIIAAFNYIYTKIQPNLPAFFRLTPKTKFEIRQTEAFRAVSASAEYNQGSADGSRPGIFYIPIIDASQFNTTSGMESLFLHEAIPGHHYQISLQQENEALPSFRRFSWYGAYGEGWALYCESLGKDLGLYKNPYQYMGALGDEIHRAIRLVVDVALHTKNMTREQAIQYMMDNEAISEESAIAEIERYMAWPAQALSYKIGALKIAELRSEFYKKHQPNAKIDVAGFHQQILKDGCLPLDVLETKMNNWINQYSFSKSNSKKVLPIKADNSFK
jgi:uncharacterized protein (DUF885 family)